MAIKLSQILPKEIFTEIPVIIEDPTSGEIIQDKITILSPTLERMEEFSQRVQDASEGEEILLALIKTFTDLEIDVDDVRKFGQATNYFGEIFDTLQIELYRILTIVVKQGFKTREVITSMDDEFVDKLKQAGVSEFGVVSDLKKQMQRS